MATQSDIVDLDEDGEEYHDPHESYELQDDLGDREVHLLSPSPRPREQKESTQANSPRRLEDDENRPATPGPEVLAANIDFTAIPDEGSDSFGANMLASLQILQKPSPLEAEQVIEQPNEHSNFPYEGPEGTNIAYNVDSYDREGATVRAACYPGLDDPAISHENVPQDFQATQGQGNLHIQPNEPGTHWHEQEPEQMVAPPGKRKKRKLRRKRQPEAVYAQQETQANGGSPALDIHAVAPNGDHLYQDATHGQTEPVVHNDPRFYRHEKLYGDLPPNSPHFQLQNEMHAAAVDEGRRLRIAHGSRDDFLDNEILEQDNQRKAPAVPNQYFQPQHDRYGPSEMGRAYTEDIRQELPSSDILGDAAQEFEHRIYRKQQAKSAKHQAERNAWQNDLRQELQAKQSLQDRLDALQHEKDELAAAIEKQKLKIAGFETMANKLKTFIGGLANDMGALKRDASAHRQNCRDVGEETKAHKTVLDGLLQQLRENAEKSSHLKNEAIKACHSAKSELATVSMRANHLEERLNEKSLLLTEEQNHREQIQSQLSSAADSGDATLRLLKSSEQTVLDKLSEIAASVAEVDNGQAISEQLGKTLAAVQGLNSQQAATVNDIVSVKGIVERLSESLNKRNDDAEHQTDEESFLKTYIDEALKSLKSDLFQHEKLAIQDATNRETILGLQKGLEDVNARVAECDSSLSSTRAHEAQLKEQNVFLEAKVATLQSQVVPGEQDSVQLSQLKAELSLKVTDLQTAKSELESKADDLRNLTTTNGELLSQLDALELRLNEAPTTTSLGAERTKLEEEHREEIKKLRDDTAANTAEFVAESSKNSANALKQFEVDRQIWSSKLSDKDEELASSTTRLDELRSKHASEVSSMQRKIDLAENVMQDRNQGVDSLKSDLEKAQRAAQEVNAIKTQLATEKQAARKADQENKSLVEKMQQLRREYNDDEERFNQRLQQCHSDNKDLGERLKAEVHATEERGRKAAKQMENSAQKAISTERANHDKQVQALQKSVHNLQTDLQSKNDADDKFQEELQRSWQTEEQKNHEKFTELNGKILEAETQRDEAVVENERLREELAEAHTLATSIAAEIPKMSTQPVEVASSCDPRLQNRLPEPVKDVDLRDTIEPSQGSRTKKRAERTVQAAAHPVATHGTTALHSSASSRGPVVEESQQEPYGAFNSSHNKNQESPQDDRIQSQRSRGPDVEESQQQSYSLFGDSHNVRAQNRPGDFHQSKLARGPVVEESQQQPFQALSHSQSKENGRGGRFGEQHQQNSYSNISSPIRPEEHADRLRQNTSYSHDLAVSRGPIVEESQRDYFSLSQDRGHHQQGHLSQRQDTSKARARDTLAETQFVPQTQYEQELQAEPPSFANFHAASTMRKDKEHEVASSAFEVASSAFEAASSAFDNNPGRTGAQVQRHAPRHFQRSMPPPNTATRMVRTGRDSSSLSSLSQEETMPASKVVPVAVTKYKTPEPRSLGGKPQPTQSIVSGSSPSFVEQMAKTRSQNTYHQGGSDKKAGVRNNSNHKEPRAAAPKRKAQSQVVQGYEPERKKKQVNRSSQGDGLDRRGEGLHRSSQREGREGHALSELVASQNRHLQAPSSSRGTPRASTQPSRVQTLAGATTAATTRQTRNATRKLTKNEEMNARFARELNGAR